MKLINYNDIVNTKCGKLLVLNHSKLIKQSNKNRHYYNCLCDCGKEKEIFRDTLVKYLKTKYNGSCGCEIQLTRTRQAKLRLEKGEDKSQITYLYSSQKGEAKYRKLDFNLTKDEFKKLISGNCHYCNDIPRNLCKPKKYYGSLIYSGIDRIDSSKGYITSNVVSCCKTCNRGKNDMSYKDFISYLKRIGEIYGK